MGFDVLNSGRDDVAAVDNWLSQRVAKLESKVGTGSAAAGGSGGPSAISPHSPFVLGYQQTKRRIRAQVSIDFTAGSLVRLKVLIIRTADRSNAASFNDNMLSADWDLAQGDITAGHVEFLLPITLEYSTKYDLVRLIGIDGQGNRVFNPTTDPVFNAAALTQFTTPDQFGAPSCPSTNLVVSNGITTGVKHFVASFGLRVYAPTDPNTGAARTYAAAGADQAVAVLQYGTDPPFHVKHTVTNAESTQIDPNSTPINRGYVDLVVQNVVPGTQVTWLGNKVWTVDTSAPAECFSSVSFTAGGGQIDPHSLNCQLPCVSPTLTIVTTDPYTTRNARADFTYTQPNSPVYLHHCTLYRRKHGVGATFDQIGHKKRLDQDEELTPGLHTLPVVEGIVMKPSTQYDFELVIVGITGISLTLDIVISIGADGLVNNDTAVPVITVAPILQYQPHHNVQVSNMITSSQFTIPADPPKYIVLYNGNTIPAQQIFFDLPNYVLSGTVNSTTEALARYPVGQKNVSNTRIRLQDLNTVFGNTGLPLTNNHVVAYWYAVNQIGTSLKSPDSNVVDISNSQTFLTGQDAVAVIDVSTTLWSPGQLLYNGNFVMNDGNPNELKKWANLFSNAPISTAGVTFWDQVNNNVVFTSSSFNANNIFQNLKRRLSPGEFFAFSFLAKGNGTAPIVVQVELVDVLSGVNDTTSVPLITINPTGTFVLYGGVLQYNPNTTHAASTHGFVLAPISGCSAANTLIIDRLMMNRGKQPSAFTPRMENFELNGAGTSEDSDSIPSTSGTGTFDISNPTGKNPSQGNWVSSGSGTKINLSY